MVFSIDFASPASIFSAYASITGLVMMIKPMVHTLIPKSVENYVVSYIKSLVGSRSSTLTLHIDDMSTDRSGIRQNVLYPAFEAYLSSKISPDASRLRMTREPNNKNVNLFLCDGEVVSDIYQGIKLEWLYAARPTVQDGEQLGEKIDAQSLQLSFDKKHRVWVLNSYVPYVESEAKVIKDESRILKLYSYSLCRGWRSVNFEHPSTFDTMAMNNELKRSVIEDIDRFIKRKDFYKRVGKAWKRGYLLYGPPGTGKTSLVAAMANYLNFDIYDLQLGSVKRDADLRSLLLGVNNRSILLVEDIDCSVDLPTRLQPATENLGVFKAGASKPPLTLSGLLNCIDGLWSSCGNERIIIFTTNNKDKLDPALLRPGRMDMHIYMGHCGFEGFKTLASNYLGMSHDNDDDPHCLCPEIKHLIDGQVLTPAQVAEELMKNEDADAALEGLVRVLKRKRSEPEKRDDDEPLKKMKKLEEGDMRVTDVDEASRRQVLTRTQVEDEEKVIDDEDDDLALEDEVSMGESDDEFN